MSNNLMCLGFHLQEEKDQRGEWYLCKNSVQFVRLKGGAFASAIGTAGALGALFGSLMQRPKITIDIPYTDILSVELIPYKTVKEALCIKTKDSCIYARVDKPQKWLEDMQSRITVTDLGGADN